MGILAVSLLLVIASTCAATICKPKTVKYDGPKKCFCLIDGTGWVCAASESAKLIIGNHRMISQTPEEERCEPGKFFNNYCNECLCGNDGKRSLAACTEMHCDPKLWNQDGSSKVVDEVVKITRKVRDTEKKCEPGKWFPKGCNTCLCGTNGLVSRAACTRVLCAGEDWSKYDMLKDTHESMVYPPIETSSDGEERCMPGRTFKRYCNDCTCGPDGRALLAKCSKNFCDRELWAKDGTMKVEIEFVPMSGSKGIAKSYEYYTSE